MSKPPAGESDPLLQRLTRLERRQRSRDRTWLAVAIAGGLLLATSMQDPTPEQDPQTPRPESVEVRAQRFVLTDDAQRPRGLWETDAEGQPSLRLLDADAHTRATLRLDGDEVVLLLHDDHEGRRLGLSVDTAGLPHLILIDGAGHPKMHLSVNAAGRPNLLCRADEGALVAGIGVLDDGTGWVRPGAVQSR